MKSRDGTRNRRSSRSLKRVAQRPPLGLCATTSASAIGRPQLHETYGIVPEYRTRQEFLNGIHRATQCDLAYDDRASRMRALHPPNVLESTANVYSI